MLLVVVLLSVLPLLLLFLLLLLRCCWCRADMVGVRVGRLCRWLMLDTLLALSVVPSVSRSIDRQAAKRAEKAASSGGGLMGKLIGGGGGGGGGKKDRGMGGESDEDSPTPNGAAVSERATKQRDLSVLKIFKDHTT